MRALERLCLAFMLAATPAAAIAQDAVEIPPDIMEALQMDVSTIHMELTQANIRLQPAQSGPFWSIYGEYLGDVQSLTTERAELIRDFATAYGTMTDAQAVEVGHRVLAFNARRDDLVARYFDRIASEVSGLVAGQFLQIENRIWTLKDLRLQVEIPIVGR